MSPHNWGAGGGDFDFVGEHEIAEDADAELAGAGETEAGSLGAAFEIKNVVAAVVAADEEVIGDKGVGESNTTVLANDEPFAIIAGAQDEGDSFLVA